MPTLQPMSVTLPLVSPESDFIAAICRAAKAPSDGELSNALSGARAQLAALVNAMFWASVTTEEGRPTTGIVSLCPPDHPNASSFEEPVAVTRESLVRLLTALPVTALAAYPSGSGCRIWGYLHQWPFFEPTVRIVGPGALVVLGQHDTHAVLSEGRVRIPPKPVGFFNLAHILETNLEVEEQNDRLRLTFALQLMMLAMQRHGHGGTILMGPTTGDAWLRSVRASHVFQAPTTSHLCQLMQDIATLQAARVADGVDAHREQFRRSLDRTGQLTAVDGALVLREDLTVVGFGAKLVVDGAEFEVARFDALVSSPLEPMRGVGAGRHAAPVRGPLRPPAPRLQRPRVVAGRPHDAVLVGQEAGPRRRACPASSTSPGAKRTRRTCPSRSPRQSYAPAADAAHSTRRSACAQTMSSLSTELRSTPCRR